MPSPKNNRSFTAADIAQYHNGSMPPAQMHALEKAALDDPFLADALDGYVHTNTPAADVAFLKKQLRRRSSNVVFMQQRRFALSAAAMLLLLAGFGWLAYQFSSTNKQDIALRNEAAPKQKTQVPLSAPAAVDSLQRADEDVTVTKKEAAKDIAVATKTPENRAQSKTETKAPVHETAKATAAPPENQTFSNPHAADVSLARQARNTMANLEQKKLFKAKVIDISGKPVPYAVVTDVKHKNNSTRTDTAGRFSMATPDSSLTVLVQSPGYQALQINVAPTDSTAIVLPPGEAALSEVAVTGFGKDKAAKSRVRLEAAEPRSDRSRFDAYVTENIEALQEDDSTRSGEVTLAFDIDKKGNATNIIVEKSLCAACDSTAARLIRDGARWRKTGKGMKAKAHLRF